MKRYFKLDYSRVFTIHLYQHIVDALVAKWGSADIKTVELFSANFTDMYVIIDAERWYDTQDANNPEYVLDAEDNLKSNGKIVVRCLSSRPRPEKNYIGKWQKFQSSEELDMYLQPKIERIKNQLRSTTP